MEKSKHNWFEIQREVKEDFLNTLENQELIMLVKTLNVKVPGFNKRMENAPIPLLKQRFELKLNSINPLDKFMKSYGMPKLEEVKNLNYEEGLKNIASDESLSNSEIIALLSILYADKYLELRERFKRNIIANKNLLDGIVKIKLVDVLESLISRNILLAEKTFNEFEFAENKVNHDDFILAFNKDFTLNSAVATSIMFRTKENEDLSENELKSLFKLSVIEMINLYKIKLDQFSDIENISKEKDAQIIKLKRNIEKLEKKYHQLGQDKKEKEKNLIKEFEKYKELSRDDRESSQNEIEKLKKELQIRKSSDDYLFNESDTFILFTTRPDEYANYIHESKLMDIEDLESYLVKDENIVFVDVCFLSTKSKRKIKSIAKKTKCKLMLLNGSSSNIIRNIIYFLEGDGLLEIK